MLRIGPYTLDANVILAPMAGVTDQPFRNLCRNLGAGMAVSEMLSADVRLWNTEKSRRRLDHRGESSPQRQRLREQGALTRLPVTDYVAATSVGVIGGTPMLDLAYDDDSRAEVDMNVVKTSDGRFIEVQGTAETKPFDRAALDALLALADRGIQALFEKQREVVGKILKY